MGDDDEIRSVRWKRETWDVLEQIEAETDRSKHWIANTAVIAYAEMRRSALGSYPPPSPDAGVSTYRATLEFQLPAKVWSDAQAYDLFFEFLERLKSLAPNQQEAYGQIDAIRSMEYDPRFADVRLPGSDRLHKIGTGSDIEVTEKQAPVPAHSLEQVAAEALTKPQALAGLVKPPAPKVEEDYPVQKFETATDLEEVAEESLTERHGYWAEMTEDRIAREVSDEVDLAVSPPWLVRR